MEQRQLYDSAAFAAVGHRVLRHSYQRRNARVPEDGAHTREGRQAGRRALGGGRSLAMLMTSFTNGSLRAITTRRPALNAFRPHYSRSTLLTMSVIRRKPESRNANSNA